MAADKFRSRNAECRTKADCTSLRSAFRIPTSAFLHLCSSAFICGVFLLFSGCASPHPYNPGISRGVAFLIKDQQPEGYWGTGLVTRGFEVDSMVPGSLQAFRVGTTSLCIMALRQAGDTEAGETAPEVHAAHDRALNWLLTHGDARRDDGELIYNSWAHIYATEALAIEMRYPHDPQLSGRIATAAQYHVDQMVRYACYTGGWNYYDFSAETQSPSMEATSFETAAGLIALHEAQQSGLTVPQPLINHSLDRLAETRLPTGTYLYGADYRYYQQIPANLVRGSIGRTQPDNLALLLYHSPTVTLSDARNGLKLFWADHAFLEMGRKSPLPHTSWYQTSGYYYYFDHYYASLLIDLLPPTERPALAQKLVTFILPHQEPDGSWWDFAMWDFHKPYGTAFAIMTLLNCERDLSLARYSGRGPG